MKHATIFLSRQWLVATIGCMLMAFNVACGNDEPDPIPEPTPVGPTTVPRTVLVYMVATNNLGTYSYDASDLSEMLTAAGNEQFDGGRLLVYHASTSGLVLKEVTSKGIDTLKVYDNNELSVSVSRMRQVIADTKELAPAQSYGLVLWSHGSGWFQDGIAQEATNGYRSFGLDGLTNGRRMNITSLGKAIEDAEFSYVYFDCCYMGSVEVMYELRHCTPYIVASATEDPGDGMPYHLNLKNLFDTSVSVEKAMMAAAKCTFDFYNDDFVKGDCPCTMAVVKTEHIEELANVTRTIYQNAKSSVNFEYEYQAFATRAPYRTSYFDFEQYVESLYTDEALYNRWLDTLHDVVLYEAATPYIWGPAETATGAIPILRHCGLSTYIMSSNLSATTSNYNTLSWYTDVASDLFDK